MSRTTARIGHIAGARRQHLTSVTEQGTLSANGGHVAKANDAWEAGISKERPLRYHHSITVASISSTRVRRAPARRSALRKVTFRESVFDMQPARSQVFVFTRTP